MDCLLHLFPKFYNNVFLFFGLTSLGTFEMKFDWLVHLIEYPNVSITNCNLKKGLFCVSCLEM